MRGLKLVVLLLLQLTNIILVSSKESVRLRGEDTSPDYYFERRRQEALSERNLESYEIDISAPGNLERSRRFESSRGSTVSLDSKEANAHEASMVEIASGYILNLLSTLKSQGIRKRREEENDHENSKDEADSKAEDNEAHDRENSKDAANSKAEDTASSQNSVKELEQELLRERQRVETLKLMQENMRADLKEAKSSQTASAATNDATSGASNTNGHFEVPEGDKNDYNELLMKRLRQETQNEMEQGLYLRDPNLAATSKMLRNSSTGVNPAWAVMQGMQPFMTNYYQNPAVVSYLEKMNDRIMKPSVIEANAVLGINLVTGKQEGPLFDVGAYNLKQNVPFQQVHTEVRSKFRKLKKHLVREIQSEVSSLTDMKVSSSFGGGYELVSGSFSGAYTQHEFVNKVKSIKVDRNREYTLFSVKITTHFARLNTGSLVLSPGVLESIQHLNILNFTIPSGECINSKKCRSDLAGYFKFFKDWGTHYGRSSSYGGELYFLYDYDKDYFKGNSFSESEFNQCVKASLAGGYSDNPLGNLDDVLQRHVENVAKETGVDMVSPTTPGSSGISGDSQAYEKNIESSRALFEKARAYRENTDDSINPEPQKDSPNTSVLGGDDSSSVSCEQSKKLPCTCVPDSCQGSCRRNPGSGMYGATSSPFKKEDEESAEGPNANGIGAHHKPDRRDSFSSVLEKFKIRGRHVAKERRNYVAGAGAVNDCLKNAQKQTVGNEVDNTSLETYLYVKGGDAIPFEMLKEDVSTHDIVGMVHTWAASVFEKPTFIGADNTVPIDEIFTESYELDRLVPRFYTELLQKSMQYALAIYGSIYSEEFDGAKYCEGQISCLPDHIYLSSDGECSCSSDVCPRDFISRYISVGESVQELLTLTKEALGTLDSDIAKMGHDSNVDKCGDRKYFNGKECVDLESLEPTCFDEIKIDNASKTKGFLSSEMVEYVTDKSMSSAKICQYTESDLCTTPLKCIEDKFREIKVFKPLKRKCVRYELEKSVFSKTSMYGFLAGGAVGIATFGVAVPFMAAGAVAANSFQKKVCTKWKDMPTDEAVDWRYFCSRKCKQDAFYYQENEGDEPLCVSKCPKSHSYVIQKNDLPVCSSSCPPELFRQITPFGVMCVKECGLNFIGTEVSGKRTCINSRALGHYRLEMRKFVKSPISCDSKDSLVSLSESMGFLKFDIEGNARVTQSAEEAAKVVVTAVNLRDMIDVIQLEEKNFKLNAELLFLNSVNAMFDYLKIKIPQLSSKIKGKTFASMFAEEMTDFLNYFQGDQPIFNQDTALVLFIDSITLRPIAISKKTGILKLAHSDDRPASFLPRIENIEATHVYKRRDDCVDFRKFNSFFGETMHRLNVLGVNVLRGKRGILEEAAGSFSPDILVNNQGFLEAGTSNVEAFAINFIPLKSETFEKSIGLYCQADARVFSEVAPKGLYGKLFTLPNTGKMGYSKTSKKSMGHIFDTGIVSTFGNIPISSFIAEILDVTDGDLETSPLCKHYGDTRRCFFSVSPPVYNPAVIVSVKYSALDDQTDIAKMSAEDLGYSFHIGVVKPDKSVQILKDLDSDMNGQFLNENKFLVPGVFFCRAFN